MIRLPTFFVVLVLAGTALEVAGLKPPLAASAAAASDYPRATQRPQSTGTADAPPVTPGRTQRRTPSEPNRQFEFPLRFPIPIPWPGVPQGVPSGASKPPVVRKQPPVATVLPERREVQKGQEARFDGSRSRDPDGTIRAWSWTLDGFPAGRGRTVILATGDLADGDHAVSLEVTDDDGLKNSAAAVVTVRPAPPPARPPVARISPRQSRVAQGQEARFDGGGSSAADGKIRTWNWAIDNRSEGRRASIAVDTASLRPGEHRLRLTVTDGRGLAGSDEARLIVEAPPEFDAAVAELKAFADAPPPSRDIRIRAVVANRGKAPLENITVRIETGERLIAEQILPSLGAGETREVTARWFAEPDREQVIVATVNPDNRPPERNRTNNAARLAVAPLAPKPAGGSTSPGERPTGGTGGDDTPPPADAVEHAVFLEAGSSSGRAGEPVQFTARVTPPAAVAEFKFDFGDRQSSDWTPRPAATHTYERAGTYRAAVAVRIAGARTMQSPAIEIVLMGPNRQWLWVLAGSLLLLLAAAAVYGLRKTPPKTPPGLIFVPRLDLDNLQVATQGKPHSGVTIGLRAVGAEAGCAVETSGTVFAERK